MSTPKQQSLEDIAKPLTVDEAEEREEGATAEATAAGTTGTAVRAGFAQPTQRSMYPPTGAHIEQEIAAIEAALARADRVVGRDDLHRRVRGQSRETRRYRRPGGSPRAVSEP